MEHKECPKCGKTKPMTEFHKNAQRKDGRAVYCKQCVSNLRTKTRKPIKEKKCTICKKTKPLSEFYFSNRKNKSGTVTKHYTSYCKDCQKLYNAKKQPKKEIKKEPKKTKHHHKKEEPDEKIKKILLNLSKMTKSQVFDESEQYIKTLFEKKVFYISDIPTDKIYLLRKYYRYIADDVRKCRICLRWLEKNKFYSYSNKNRKIQLSTVCIECSEAYKKEFGKEINSNIKLHLKGKNTNSKELNIFLNSMLKKREEPEATNLLLKYKLLNMIASRDPITRGVVTYDVVY